MAAITESVPQTADQYNEDILAVLSPPTPLYVIAVLLLLGVVGAGVGALAVQTYFGMGVTGLMLLCHADRIPDRRADPD